MFARFKKLVLISVSIVHPAIGSYEILNYEIVPLLTKHKKTTIFNLLKDNVDLGLGSTTKRLIKLLTLNLFADAMASFSCSNKKKEN
jgi:hypothetical protein